MPEIARAHVELSALRVEAEHWKAVAEATQEKLDVARRELRRTKAASRKTEETAV